MMIRNDIISNKDLNNCFIHSRFGTNLLVLERKESGVLLVALSCPKSRNAFSDEMYMDLIHLLDYARDVDTITAVVFTGDGPYFSSGANLKELDNVQKDQRNTLELPSGKFMMAILSFPKILAAAVNGPAIGIGVTLLFHCDLCYCTPNATFWIPFTRLALVPEFCSSATIIETIGLAKANELLLLGQKIDANTAVQWNICSKVIENSNSSIDDPFHSSSIGIQVCEHIEKNLLSYPFGKESSTIFVKFLRGKRQERLRKVCKEELLKLDERFNRGDCLEAARHLNFGKSKL